MRETIVRSCPFTRTLQSVNVAVWIWARARDARVAARHRSRGSERGANDVTRSVGSLFYALVFSAVITPCALFAQTEPSKGAATSDGAGPVPVLLGRFIPKDDLILYAEFAGLDEHAASWEKTASYKMLNETPLGAMLESVAAQLIDKPLALMPNRRLSGPEIVTLLKGIAKSGFAVAVHVDPKVNTARLTIVLRGVVSKELKPLSSRLVGWMMGADAKPKTERKEGRTVVVVPAVGISPSWVWWPEKNDLVLGVPYPRVSDTIIAALDGKAPSAVEHPIAQELRKREGSFEPVGIAFVDVAACPVLPIPLTKPLNSLADSGVKRLDYQWGLDAEALMTVTRVVAPKPWKTGLALFDQPTFEKTSLLPMPETVTSFVELSVTPNKLLEALENIGPPGAFKAQFDKLSDKIKSAGQIDLRKDILGHLGPRMVAYLAAGRSATANDDSLESALKNGFSGMAAVTAMQSYLPKLTLVAEVDDRVAFGKGLDTMIIAINNELEAQAKEKEEEEERKTPDAEKTAAGERGRGKRAGGGGERSKSHRVLAPRFTPIPGATKSFVLMTPSDSKLRFGPSSFRPTIWLEGKFVAFAVTTDAARAAVAAAAHKDWKPSTEIERACEHVPSKLIMLSVNDNSESLSSILASLPGTLQTLINTTIALSKARANGALASGPNAPTGSNSGMGMQPGMSSPPGGPGMRGPGGPGMRGRMGGPSGGGSGPMSSGGPGPGAIPGGPGGTPGAPGFGSGSTGNSGAPGSENDAMIVIKVDSDKLPKAGDLKAHLFPATLTVQGTDQEIRFVSRTAFPDPSVLIGMIPAFGMIPTPPGLSGLPGAPTGAPAAGGETPAGPAAGSQPGGPGAPGAPGGGPGGLRRPGPR